MMNLKVIGAGAAGNKAALTLIEKGFNKDNVVLLNSTRKDIPESYDGRTIIFGSHRIGGCGKERDMGKQLILNDLRNNEISFDNIVDPDTNAVIIVSSTEGGSGSASTPIVAKYIKEVIGVPVIIVLLFGFNNDVRGMQNSIEICQELQDNYGVIGISNAKFLEQVSKNTAKAERMANEQFAKIVRIISGQDIIPSDQNIDDTDLLKIITTPGYMMVENVEIGNIKNVELCDKLIKECIDNSTLVDTSKGVKRMGIIYEVESYLYDNIDLSAGKIKDCYGIPYEIFTHLQPESAVEGKKSNISWIIAGAPMPIKEVEAIYNNYMENTSRVNKDFDTFFDDVSSLKGQREDGKFNMLGFEEEKISKSDFFSEFGFNDNKKSKIKKTSSNIDEY